VTSVGYNGSAPATVAGVLETRGEQVARQWADLPPFRDVHTTGRDVALEAARRLIEVLTEVVRDGRPDDTSAPGFDRIRPHLAQTLAGALQWAPRKFVVTVEAV
jgi:rsbT co-antagonist protein RsbR